MSIFRRSIPTPRFEFPSVNDRTAIVGATGEGKSTFAFWLFAESANFSQMPWVIVDYKNEADDIINKLVRNKDAFVIPMDREPPSKPGIYVIKPDPLRPNDIVGFLWRVYARGNMGVVFDELTMVPNQLSRSDNPLKALLTQGRAKKIPLYLLTQRPVDVSISVFSDATFISEFRLNRREDRIRVRTYIPDDVELFQNVDARLKRYHSRWWDSRRQIALALNPPPPPARILDMIADRVDRMRQTQRL